MISVETQQKQGIKRPRNAETTKQAILESARAAFIRFGYDGVGLREIAQDAGVTAMLVNRYFGSKEQLFEEIVEAVLTTPGVLTTGLATPGAGNLSAFSRDVALTLARKTGPMDGFLILLRSAANDQARAILTAKLTQHFAKPLGAKLKGRDAAQRAGLFLALIAGVLALREVAELPGLSDADPYDLADRLRDVFELLALGEA